MCLQKTHVVAELWESFFDMQWLDQTETEDVDCFEREYGRDDGRPDSVHKTDDIKLRSRDDSRPSGVVGRLAKLDEAAQMQVRLQVPSQPS